MSRKHRRHSERRSLVWPILIAGGILLIAAAFLFANRGDGGGRAGGAPQISVDQQKIDFGYVAFGNDRQFTVKVTNAGDGALRFRAKPYIQVLEGC